MRAPIAYLTVLLILYGCAAATPDPRALASQPIKTAVPLAPQKEGIYTLPGTGVNHILLLFPGGTVLDPHGKEGAVQLLCAAMIKGGTAGKSPEQVANTLGQLAIDVSIAAQRDYTLVGLTFLPDVTDQAVTLLLDVLRTPRLDPKRIEIERKIFIDTVIRDEENAVTVAFDTYRSHYYRDDPRGYKPTPESIRAVTREDLLALYPRIFANTPMIGVIGSLDQRYGMLLKSAYPAAWSPNPIGPAPNPEFGTFTDTAKEKQCVLLMAHAAPTMLAPDYAASIVADHIIGSGGFNALLVKEVRTRRGLAYAAESFYQARPRWGVFGFFVVTEPAAIGEVKQALETVLAEIRRGIPAETVAWAKQAVINSHAVPYNNPATIIQHTMDMAFYGIPPDFDAVYLARVAALTPEEVQSAALKLIRGPWVEVVVNAGGATGGTLP